MCGIAGFCLNRNEKVDAVALSKALLGQIIQRGTDATGAAWVIPSSHSKDKKATIAVSKAPVPASSFGQYMTSMPQDAQRVILHTRLATQGSPENNLNNHPIISGGIVGVHNGGVRNDDEVFQHIRAPRLGQVDSEAAFALLAHTTYHPKDVLASLQGRVALAWLNARDKRDLSLCRVAGSPLAIGQTAKGSFIFASTMPLLVNACAKTDVELRWVEEISEMTYLRVRNGEIMELETIGASLKEIV